jgi:hypothetical protein
MRTQACTMWFASATLLTLCLAGLASAQQKYPYHQATPAQSSQYVQQHSIEVGDIPGHQIRIYEIQRGYTSEHPLVMGTKVVESWTRGFSDYVNGIGPTQGYSTTVLEDGNKIFEEWRGTSYSAATSTGSRRGTYHGTDRFVGGTGKFATIRGVLTCDTEFDTDPKTGYNRSVCQGEYWFEQ